MPVLIGLDYGLRRTGIAVSDATGRIALAVGTHVEGRHGSLIQRIGALATTHRAQGLVVGWPLRTDGSAGDMADRVQRFAERLHEELGLPITLLDERYSSQEAARAVGLRGRPARREELDTVAAQLILQTHLDRLQAGGDREPR